VIIFEANERNKIVIFLAFMRPEGLEVPQEFRQVSF